MAVINQQDIVTIKQIKTELLVAVERLKLKTQSELRVICDRLELVDKQLSLRISNHLSGPGDDHSLVRAITKRTNNFLRYGGQYTTNGGGPTEDISLLGVTPDHHCLVVMKEVGAAPVTIETAKTDTDKLTVTYSADPSTDHIVTYLVF